MPRNRKFKSRDVDFEQIDKFLKGAKKKFNSAKRVLVIDKELSYQTAYEAMIKASLAFILSFGKRPRALPGHHIAIINFIEKNLGKNHRRLLGLFDDMRKKRNQAIYEVSGFISEYEAKEALKTTQKFIGVIEDKISKIHPQKKLV